MLPKALYGERPWREALAETLANPKVHDVSGGKADDRRFFCAAILGAPSLWAQAREAARKGNVVEAVKRSITAARRSLTESLDYDFGGGLTGSAEAVVVICPAIAKDMNPGEPTLEAAAVDPETAAGLFGLAVHAAFDDWRNSASASLAKVTTLCVAGHGEVPVILDGETVRLGRTVDISFLPLAFRALVPAEASIANRLASDSERSEAQAVPAQHSVRGHEGPVARNSRPAADRAMQSFAIGKM